MKTKNIKNNQNIILVNFVIFFILISTLSQTAASVMIIKLKIYKTLVFISYMTLNWYRFNIWLLNNHQSVHFLSLTKACTE